MTDHPNNRIDPNRDPVESHSQAPDGLITVVGRSCPAAEPRRDSLDLAMLFLWWSLATEFRNWKGAVRALARALQGLERLGFIDRRTVRRPGHRTHDGFVPTDGGLTALIALSGDSIRELER